MSVAQFLSNEPVSREDKEFYDECKLYHQLTQQPLVSVSNEIFDETNDITSAKLKIAIDQTTDALNLNELTEQLKNKLNLNHGELSLVKIQSDPSLLEYDISIDTKEYSGKVKLKSIYSKLTDEVKEDLGRMKVFFMFLGSTGSFLKKLKYRKEITVNSTYNRLYDRNHIFWQGPLNDGRDRGGQPYYCPVGWKRYAFFVCENFDEKFKGWCICYHGTRFSKGLSILLSGLMPSNDIAHGEGIYTSPSIIYAAHPRYAEVEKIKSDSNSEFFKQGDYLQFVMECRVHPSNFKIGSETLATRCSIDPNIDNDKIEWIVDHQGKEIVDFSDPNGSIICTGVMIRLLDNHPALLSESGWWFDTRLRQNPKWDTFFESMKVFEKQREQGKVCNIIHS